MGFQTNSAIVFRKEQKHFCSYNPCKKETIKNLIYIPIALVEIFFTVETNLFKNNLWQMQ